MSRWAPIILRGSEELTFSFPFLDATSQSRNRGPPCSPTRKGPQNVRSSRSRHHRESAFFFYLTEAEYLCLHDLSRRLTSRRREFTFTPTPTSPPSLEQIPTLLSRSPSSLPSTDPLPPSKSISSFGRLVELLRARISASRSWEFRPTRRETSSPTSGRRRT